MAVDTQHVPVSLTDRVALVTGSTSGIGRGIAQLFAALGAKVIVHGRDPDRARDAAQALADQGGQARSLSADLVDDEACRTLIDEAAGAFGGLDILVNNAADTSRGDVEDTPVQLWDRILAVNLRAPFVLLQRAIPHFRRTGGGSVVNIGSINAYIGEPKLCAYSVSKGGLMTLTKNAAALLNRDRIRVNQINAGWTLTEGEDRVKREQEGQPANWLAEAVKTRPFGRLLSPADIAYAAAYFASDASACVTGTVLDLEQYPVGAPPNW
ncbi:MAG: SDR family oxidoreductase [Luteitalea sp.]|nr:SDR family oxidoreductase [Luteitalea sp.]